MGLLFYLVRQYLIRRTFIFLPLVFSAFVLQAQLDKNEEHFPIKSEIIVFPNPAENTVHILGLENSDRANILISNTSGTIILQHHWEIRNNSLSIPIPNLQAGIYILAINSKEQQIKRKFYKK